MLLLAGAAAVVLMFQRDGTADIVRGVSLLGGAVGIVGAWRFLRDERQRFGRDGPTAILDEGWLPPFAALALSLASTVAMLVAGAAAVYGLNAVGCLLSGSS